MQDWRQAASAHRSAARAFREKQVRLIIQGLEARVTLEEIAEGLDMPCSEVVHLSQLSADDTGWTRAPGEPGGDPPSPLFAAKSSQED